MKLVGFRLSCNLRESVPFLSQEAHKKRPLSRNAGGPILLKKKSMPHILNDLPPKKTGPLGKGGEPRHTLTHIDEINKTAVCVLCGPVEIRRKGLPTATWSCSKKLNLARLNRLDRPELAEECEICKRPALHRDHCHTTEKWRGSLCRHCNLGLGFFADDVARMHLAIEYIEKYRQLHSE